MNALVPTDTIEQIVAYRDAALTALYEAYDVFEHASHRMNEGFGLWKSAAAKPPRFYHDHRRDTEAFILGFQLPQRQHYVETVRRLLDTDVWNRIIELAGIKSLMDTQARDELSKQMAHHPLTVRRDGELIDEEEAGKGLPPVTVDNIISTLEKFQAEKDHIFKRGLANVFAALERSFRSHDGFKFGNRIILERACESSWHGRLSGWRQNQIEDVERAFLILDGKDPRASYGSIAQRINIERPNNHYQTEHEGDYFKIRIFKNGNAHLWFTRKDLLFKVNQILGEWYGETIGDGRPQEKDPLNSPKTGLAKNFGFYPTPEDVAKQVLKHMNISREPNEPELRILEPSSGTGNLARRFAEEKDLAIYDRNAQEYQIYTIKPLVDCVEIQADEAEKLKAEGIYNRVTMADFLVMNPDPKRLYDIVGMNPPFDRERDIDRVIHALKFLKAGGRLVSIMSAGTEFRQTKKSIAFRALMSKWNAEWHDLPMGSFASVGTNINTLILVIDKPEN